MIHIIQCLCPQRHCILALAYDDTEGGGEEILGLLQATVAGSIEQGLLNPWCGICQAREWTYEDGKTHFTSLAEAKPFLEQCQRDQMDFRTMLDLQRAANN